MFAKIKESLIEIGRKFVELTAKTEKPIPPSSLALPDRRNFDFVIYDAHNFNFTVVVIPERVTAKPDDEPME